jgi:hypothetical protein
MSSDVEGLDLEAVWRVCRVIRGDCKNCPASETFDGDECVRGCVLQATECINTVETGNPWRKAEGVKPPWTAHAALTERVRELEGERDEARNAVVKCKDVALAIADRIEDEGDRAYFGSTNDPDMLKALARELDDLHWHYVRPAPHPAEARAEAAERRAGELEGALREIVAVRILPATDNIWDGANRCRAIAARALLPATQAEGEK